MALDREHGEAIEGLGGMFRVVPTDKWANSDLFTRAALAATAAFKKSAGRFHDGEEIMNFSRDQVLVQEYPLLNTLAFVFEGRVHGKDMIYPYTFHFPPDLISKMSVEGLWNCSLPKKN